MFKLILLFTLLSTLVGCKEIIEAIDNKKSVEGETWRGVTSLDQLDGLKYFARDLGSCINSDNGKSSSEIFELLSDKLILKKYSFDVHNCSQPLYSFENIFDKFYHDGSDYGFQLAKQTIVVLNQNLANSFNSSNFCGFNNWTVNIPKIVTFLSCSSIYLQTLYLDKLSVSSNFMAISFLNVDNIRIYLDSLSTKSINSLWTSIDDPSFSINYSGSIIEGWTRTDITTTLTSDWLTELNTRGLNTSGLVVGRKYSCSVWLTAVNSGSYIPGYDSYGTIKLDLDWENTPTQNACLVLDNECSGSYAPCNINQAHNYYIYGSNLTLDYFGTNSSYGFGYFK